jgi:hypothetical protein
MKMMAALGWSSFIKISVGGLFVFSSCGKMLTRMFLS